MSGPALMVPPAELDDQKQNRPGSRLASVTLIHGLLVAALAISALVLFADSCGGGDLCLGGLLGIVGLAVAGVVLIGLAVRAYAGRSSILVAIDSLVAVILGPTVFRELLSLSFNPATLFAIGVVVLAIAGAVLAAREVSRHRVERVVLVAALILIGVVVGLGRVDGTVGLAIVALVIGATVWPQPMALAGADPATEAGPTAD
jgi:hypothetical protein